MLMTPFLKGWHRALLGAVLAGTGILHAAAPESAPAQPEPLTLEKCQAALRIALTRHLDLLLRTDFSAGALKGKSASGEEAFAFYRMFELTKEPKYQAAAVALSDQVLKQMRETKFGVIAIKEKTKPGGTKITGGGPPPLAFYTARLGYVLSRVGGREEDLRYVATVLDKYPWNEGGWWAADMDVNTGDSKEPITKPSPVNKTTCMTMAAFELSRDVRKFAPELAASLQRKAEKCLYDKVIPAQLPDGFWHYGLTEKDPGEKDVLGYFMLTTRALMELQHAQGGTTDPRLQGALEKAQAFALNCVVPGMEPNTGTVCPEHKTRGTPDHYALQEQPKRGYELALILLGSGHLEEGLKIMQASLKYFPYGNDGQDGAHAAEPVAVLLDWLK